MKLNEAFALRVKEILKENDTMQICTTDWHLS